MNATLNPSCPQSTSATRRLKEILLGGRRGAVLRAVVAATAFAVAPGTGTAVTISVDNTTMGNWIGSYGSCAYILPGGKVPPGVELPLLPGLDHCDNATCPLPGHQPPLTPGGGNYGGGATVDLTDCTGQTQAGGFSDALSYSVRLCTNPSPYPTTLAQGYVWTGPAGNYDPNGCMMQVSYPTFNQTPQFPTDPRGIASCTPLGQGCTVRPGGRIAGSWDDAAENTASPSTGAGLCVDIDLSAIPAAQRNANYRLSGYFLDYDNLQRDLTVKLFDQTLGSLIASSPVTSFQTGAYLRFDQLNPLPTHLTLQINRNSASDINAVISGLFLDKTDGSVCAGPHITLKKLTNGVDTPNPNDGNAPLITAGSTVNWSYIVTNDGTEDLKNVSVTDDKVGSICVVGFLPVGASQTCAKTGTAITIPPGGVIGVCGGVPNKPLYENKGTANGTGNVSNIPVSADYLSHYCNPPAPPGSFTLVKTPKGATYNIGQNISFTMVVTSTGPGTALNVQLSDPLPTLGNLNTWVITTNPGGCSIVANNLSCNFGDLANGQVRTVIVGTNAVGGANATACPGGVTLNNTATVTSTGLPTKFDNGSYTCTPPAPGVSIIKFTNGADANDPNGAGVPNIAPGGVVTWTYRVTNTGTVAVPRANVAVTDNTTGVTPTFTSEITGNGDTTFNPGEVWLYTATGTALNLTLPPPGGVTTVANSCTANGTQPPRTAYTNIGSVTIPGATASDPSSYCNPPPVPNVAIIKFTNGADANDPNAAGVPGIPAGGVVTWTYRVTNTGTTSVPRPQVVVTDNVTGVTPTFTSEVSGNGDTTFNPGEVWLYTATGTALDLTLPPPSGTHLVANSCSAGGSQPPSTAYTNIGTVTIPGATASDPSSYCNPPPSTPCPAGSFTFSVDANGNLNMKFDQFPAPNDNSYGANAVGWGTKGHKFQDLTGSDKAGFQIVNPSGTVVLDFNIDYISATTASAAFPSGYKSFGPFGGDGKVNTGTLVDQTDITYTSSLANNLNNVNIPGLFSGGVQQFGTGVANVLTDSPPTLDKISNYTLTPAAMAAGFNGWDFHDTYFVQLKKAKLVAIGYLNAATNQPNPGWKVQPNLTALHNSPAKPCPTGGGGGVCAIDDGPTTVDKKAFKWELTNTGTAAAVLTDVSITWPAANGKLMDIKLDGDKVYDVDTNPPSITLTSAQLESDAKKKTIDAGKTRVFTLDFQNNAATALSGYAITLKFNGTGCTVTFDGTNPPMTLSCSELKPIEQMVLEYSGTTAIQNVAFYRTSATGVPGAADLIGNSGPLATGDVFSFGDYDSANATNDVDFQITFVGGATQKSRFHLSCSDVDMQDIADCGKPEGNGKDNSVTGGNLWLLRDLQGKGKHMCNFP